MQLGLGFTKGQGVAAGKPDFAAETEAALSGSGGFALDFSDTSRMWTTATKTTLVSAPSEPIGAIQSQWGAAEFDITQGSAGSRPTWNGSIAADFVPGSTQHLTAIAAAALLQNKPAGFACARVIFDSIAANNPVFALSTNSSASRRFHLFVTTAGALTLTIRRVDGGSQTLVSSADGAIATGLPYTITMTCDYNVTQAISVTVNGVEVISTTLVETAGLVSNTASAAFWVGRAIGALDYIDGRISRMVFADKLMTAGEIASIESWVAEGALS
jgi:hypothetical protein